MNCVSCDICVYHLGLCVFFRFFPGVFLSSRVTGACPVTTDLIMRVNVRTTTTNNNEWTCQYPSRFISWGYRGEYFRHGESLKIFIIGGYGTRTHDPKNPCPADDAIC